jgi:hypothetical protein
MAGEASIKWFASAEPLSDDCAAAVARCVAAGEHLLRRRRHAEAVAALDPTLREKAARVAKRYVKKYAPDSARLQGIVDHMLEDDALVGHPDHALMLSIYMDALRRAQLQVIDGDSESPRCELPLQRPRRRF